MKVLFWILLLGNLIFFAVMQWGGLQVEPAVSLQPALQQQKISLLNMPQAKPGAVLPAADLAAIFAPAATPTSAVMPASAPAPLAARCMEWGEFSGADLARATVALSILQLGDKLSQRQIEYNIGYWVYLPPMKDKAAANRKVAQLKALGIDDYFVITDAGPWLNAISLGVFKTREAAQRFLDDLRRTKNVTTAQIGERASKLKVTQFVFNGLDVKNSADLAEMVRGFVGSELKDVPCALTR